MGMMVYSLLWVMQDLNHLHMDPDVWTLNPKPVPREPNTP